jgi:outer membrane receptor for Fe3+-dicitrate
MLKGKYAPNAVHTFNSLLQYYDGEADMPGGLSRADYAADRWQSTRLKDRFWGRRQLASLGYQFQPMRSTSSTFRASIPIRCAAVIWSRETHHAFPA